jgi:NAD+ diphosphatase
MPHTPSQTSPVTGPSIPVDEASSRNGFSPSSYDRRDDLRGIASPDGAMFDAVRFVLVSATGDRALLKVAQDGANLDPLFKQQEAKLQGADLTGENHPWIFLGAENGVGFFGVAVPPGEKDEAPYRPGSDGRIEEGLPQAGGLPVKAIDLRSVAAAGLSDGNLDQGFASLVATTRSLLDWHHRHGFCARCGTASVAGHAGWRRDCPPARRAISRVSTRW